jgi:hypothetical protein
MVDVINYFQGYTKGTHYMKKADIAYDELSHIFMNTLAVWSLCLVLELFWVP